MIVCVCARVSDRQIREAAANGAHSLECLQVGLGVAMRCGNCADCAREVLGDACTRDGAGQPAAAADALAASAAGSLRQRRRCRRRSGCLQSAPPRISRRRCAQRPPMLDISQLRKDLDSVIAALERRKSPQPFLDVDRFRTLEGERRRLQTATEELQARRNSLSRQVGMRKGKGEDASDLLAEVGGIGEQMKASADSLDVIQAELSTLLMGLPNLPHPSVPDGADERGNVRGPALGRAASLRLRGSRPCRPRRAARPRFRHRRQAVRFALQLPARAGGTPAPCARPVHARSADRAARLCRVPYALHRQPRGARGHRTAAQVPRRHVLGLARRRRGLARAVPDLDVRDPADQFGARTGAGRGGAADPPDRAQPVFPLRGRQRRT